MIYALWAAALAWNLQRELCLYLLIYALSLATVCAWSLRESWIVRRARPPLARHKSASRSAKTSERSPDLIDPHAPANSGLVNLCERG